MAARVVAAAREDRLKGKTASAREAHTREGDPHATAARATTWSLVQLSLLVQNAPKDSGSTCSVLQREERLLPVKLSLV